MFRSHRATQLLAYLAVAVTGGASVATSCGGDQISAEGPLQTLRLDPTNPRVVRRFAIHTNGTAQVRMRVSVRGSAGTELRIERSVSSEDGGPLVGEVGDAGSWTVTGGDPQSERDVCGQEGDVTGGVPRCRSTFSVTFDGSFAPTDGPLEITYGFSATADMGCDGTDPVFIEVDPA